MKEYEDIFQSRMKAMQMLTVEEIKSAIEECVPKEFISKVYLFGSYARGEADENSDLDFLVYGGSNFKLTNILAFAEDLREVSQKNVDAFEICEVNKDSDFYKTVMKEKVLVW